MRLDPHPKPVRIRLSIDQQNGSGKIVYFGLDDLLKNFDFESLVPHIVDKSLMRWLEQLRREDISNKIKQILETELDDKDETKSQEIEKFSNISEQVIEQNKYQIICLLFDGIIENKMNSDKEFLCALLKLSNEYKGTIKNILESSSFAEYSAFEFLNSLIHDCDTVFTKLIEKQLDFLQNKEEERKKREQEEKQRRETKERQQHEVIQDKKWILIKSEFDDTIQRVHCALYQRVRNGDKIITLRRTKIIAPCDGRIFEIVLGPGDYYNFVKKGSTLVILSTE